MKNFFKLGAVAIFAMVVLTGCNTLAIQNIENTPVISEKKVTDNQIKKAIKTAGEKIGWRFKDVAPGKMIGMINVRNKHTASVDIIYNEKEYSINYRNSTNLKYDAMKKTIHKAYNSWVVNLKNAIDFELSMN